MCVIYYSILYYIPMLNGLIKDNMNIDLAGFQENEDFDVSDLLAALENDDHSNLENMTPERIEDIKVTAIVDLHLNEEESEKILRKLDGYMYVDEIPDVKYGSFIRWVSIKDDNFNNLKLTNGGLVTGIDVCATGTVLTCKNNMNRFFRVRMDEAMIFKRLTDQERVILAALKYLS